MFSVIEGGKGQETAPELPKPEEKPLVQEAGVVAIIGRAFVVLVKPKSGKDEWLLPKGHLEQGENHIEAAKRELLEETGASGEWLGDMIRETSLDTPIERQQIKWFVCQVAALRTDKMTDEREIGIFPAIVALARLTYEDQREVLAAAIS